MAAPTPSDLDFSQCIQGAYDDANGRLRVDAAITAPLDVDGEVLVDIRAEDHDSVLLAGTTNGTPGGTVQYVKVNPDGSIDVNATFAGTIGTVDQGNPNTISNAWPVLITDGTDSINVNPDGSINVANVTNVVSTTATLTNKTSSTSSQVVLAINTSRKGFILYNDSTEICYIAFAATASSSSYSILLNSNMTYQNEAIIYNGIISCIWAAANGFLRITELT